MELWLIILGSALAGGFLIIDGFAKARRTSECVLQTYQDLLRQASQQHAARDGEDEDDDRQHGQEPTEDETAPYD